MSKVIRLPKREQVKTADTWDLSSLYLDNDAWEKDFKKYEKLLGGFDKFRGTLAESAKQLAACLQFDSDVDRLGDRLGTYASLRVSENQADSVSQAMEARMNNVYSKAAQAASFIRPEILAIPEKKIKQYLAAKELQPWKLVLERVLRYKPYTLSQREENILAMQSEMAGAAGHAFRQLLDADMKFGIVKNDKGEQVELTNSTFIQMLQSPNRTVRKAAFQQYYSQFSGHENTLAATLAGSIQKDVYYAKVRSYPSALEAALYPDNVPTTVYDNLVSTIRKHLPKVHQYYDVRRRKMKLKDIHHYDCYVPILTDLETKHTWAQASKVIIEALAPLGSEYCTTLEEGLNGRWCDRYPNQGKRSGAFSSGMYDSIPYILMNYQPTVLNDVFTLAHEAGHSMHTWYSKHNQPYQYYGYTIFVAEVASTFNEELLNHHLMNKAKNDRQRAYLVNREIDDIRSTIVRQTMFAEFEMQTHAMAEAGEPLTVKTLRDVYRKLLEAYFGPAFAIDDELSLECMRIPHFYRGFYVYKYATGLSAAIALSKRVLHGGERDLQHYLNFLKGGCSQDPLDLLKGAGVDMTTPKPIETAMEYFGELVEELDELL